MYFEKTSVHTEYVFSNCNDPELVARQEQFENAKKFLGFAGTAEAQDAANNNADAPFISANENASQETYTDLQKKSAEVVGAAANIAQFMDRDTNADFANTVMIPSIQEFLKNPDDIDGVTASIQEQAAWARQAA